VLNYSDLDASNPEYYDFLVYQQNLVDMAANVAQINNPDAVIGVKTSSL
jgi:hypothetical protein